MSYFGLTLIGLHVLYTCTMDNVEYNYYSELLFSTYFWLTITGIVVMSLSCCAGIVLGIGL